MVMWPALYAGKRLVVNNHRWSVGLHMSSRSSFAQGACHNYLIFELAYNIPNGREEAKHG
eukprot:3575521-Amphidinium_carterae.1